MNTDKAMTKAINIFLAVLKVVVLVVMTVVNIIMVFVHMVRPEEKAATEITVYGPRAIERSTRTH